MQSQWIDEFDQMMWEQSGDAMGFHQKIEIFCLTTLREKGSGAVVRLRQHVKDRKNGFELLELRCRVIERCTMDPDARAIVSNFGAHYTRLAARFRIADQTLETLYDIL